MASRLPTRRYLWVLSLPFIIGLLALFALGGETNLDSEARPDGIAIKSSTGDDVLLATVTNAAAGLMGPRDKAKLDSLSSAPSAPMRKLHPAGNFTEWDLVTLPPPPSTTTLEVLGRACQLARIWYGVGVDFETVLVGLAGIPPAGALVGDGTVSIRVQIVDPRVILSNEGAVAVAVGRIDCH